MHTWGVLQNKGGAGYIPAWSFWLVPDSGDVKVVADGTTANDAWAKAEPTQEMVSKLHEGLVCQYYLAPPSSDNPSAYFAVGNEEDPRKEPNMQEEDLLITSSTGLAFEFKNSGDQMKASSLASVASSMEATMQFRIKVLINCEPLYKGMLLTRPVVQALDAAAKEEKRKREAVDAAKKRKIHCSKLIEQMNAA